MNIDICEEERVLVLAPTTKDAQTTSKLLSEHGISYHICSGMQEFCAEARRGAGAGLLTEEALISDEARLLGQFSREQEPWSALPLIVLTKPGIMTRDSFSLLSSGRDFRLIDRPVQLAVLMSTIHGALRDRRRQYILRDYIAEREKVEQSLRESDRRKDEFLAMLGHELRNPLAAISSAVRLLRRPEVGEDAKNLANEALDRQVKQLARLIDDLLDVARVSKGKIQLKRIPLDVKEIIVRSIEVVRPAIESAHHELYLDLPAEDLWVSADAARLEQVLINLLSNAAKYTRTGGKIWVTAKVEDDKVTATIKDNGIGIPPKLLPKIFDLFAQGEHSLARTQGGLGIGLTLVKHLMTLHGGEIIAESSGEDRGSAFTIKLDRIAKPESAIADDPPARNPEYRKRQRVLVVDDNKDAAKTLACYLKEGGYDVQVAFNGLEAVEKARFFNPQAALLDIGLPDVSGYDLAGKLLHTPGLENLLLIAVSGYTRAADRAASKAAGFDYHLAKPVDHDQLLALLD